MEIVIMEHDNYRGRTDARYQLMQRTASRNGLVHVYDCQCRTLEDCKAIAEAEGYTVTAVGTFYQVV